MIVELPFNISSYKNDLINILIRINSTSTLCAMMLLQSVNSFEELYLNV